MTLHHHCSRQIPVHGGRKQHISMGRQIWLTKLGWTNLNKIFNFIILTDGVCVNYTRGNEHSNIITSSVKTLLWCDIAGICTRLSCFLRLPELLNQYMTLHHYCSRQVLVPGSRKHNIIVGLQIWVIRTRHKQFFNSHWSCVCDLQQRDDMIIFSFSLSGKNILQYSKNLHQTTLFSQVCRIWCVGWDTAIFNLKCYFGTYFII